LKPGAIAHAHLVRACLTYLELNGIRSFAVNQVARQMADGRWRNLGASSGAPDIMACAPGGRFLAFELKTGASKPRHDQLRVLEALKLAGATVAVVRSVDELEPIVKALRART
jgi:hypothetical protein